MEAVWAVLWSVGVLALAAACLLPEAYRAWREGP